MYRSLAWAYSSLNQLDMAESIFRQAITLAPHNIAIKLNFGAFLKRHGKYQDAIKVLTQLIETVPNYQFAYQNIANSYFLLGEIDQAIEYTKKAIDITPSAGSYSNLGTFFFYQKDYTSAINAYERVIELNDQDFLDWGNLADAYRFSNSEKTEAAYFRAIELAEQALTIKPNDGLTISILSYYLACVGEKTKALHYTKLITAEYAGAYHFYVATAYAVLGLNQEAIASLTAALNQNYSLDAIMTNPILAKLRATEAFKQWLSDIEVERQQN